MSIYDPYLHWVASQQDTMLSLVKKWCTINSGTENLAGLAAFLSALQKDFSVLEGEMHLLSLPSRTLVSPQGIPIQAPLGQALTIQKRPQAPIQILLVGHMDTVYGPSHPFQKVERLDEITLRGPGVIDMKGGLVILLTCLQALESFPDKEAIGWTILLNPDEEVGSPGSTALFQEMARKNHIGLVFEPGFGDGAFVSKRKGSANLTLIARGKSAHAGRDFHAGRNSIFALARLITEIEHLNLNEQGTTLNVGHIEGGGPVNIVPDLAICRLNIRSSTAQNLLDTLEQIRQLVQQASSKGIEIELIEDYCRLPKPFDVAHQALFEQYATCANDLHYPFLLRESGGVCDGNTLAEAGLPTLDSLGAIGGLMHTDEEYLLIPSLVQRAQIATLFLLKLASGAISLPK